MSMMVCGTVELLGGLRATSLASFDIFAVFGFALCADFCEATLVAVFFAVDFVAFLLGGFLLAIYLSSIFLLFWLTPRLVLSNTTCYFSAKDGGANCPTLLFC
jgi:hypothetical protein